MITREKIVKKIVKGKSVLDLGNSWGDFKDLIKINCQEYSGLDLEPGAQYQHDLNKPFNLNKKFDVIIAGELIEHIENTGVFLDNIKKHLTNGGTFFLTTLNPTSFRFFFYLFFNKEPDFNGHVKYFTYDALRLVLKERFVIKKVGFNHYVTNNPNRDKFSWKIKFFTECLIGDLIPRLSPHIYVVCKIK